jgi:hypothetical protein
MTISDLFTKPTVGNIMHDSIFFYQVVQTTNKMVKIKAIGVRPKVKSPTTFQILIALREQLWRRSIEVSLVNCYNLIAMILP